MTIALFGSNKLAIMHPNGTPIIKGVRNAIPIRPYPFLMITNRLRFLYLILKMLNRSRNLEITEPRKVKTKTPRLPPAATINISHNHNRDDLANNVSIATIYLTEESSIHPPISKNSDIIYAIAKIIPKPIKA